MKKTQRKTDNKFSKITLQTLRRKLKMAKNSPDFSFFQVNLDAFLESMVQKRKDAGVLFHNGMSSFLNYFMLFEVRIV